MLSCHCKKAPQIICNCFKIVKSPVLSEDELASRNRSDAINKEKSLIDYSPHQKHLSSYCDWEKVRWRKVTKFSPLSIFRSVKNAKSLLCNVTQVCHFFNRKKCLGNSCDNYCIPERYVLISNFLFQMMLTMINRSISNNGGDDVGMSHSVEKVDSQSDHFSLLILTIITTTILLMMGDFSKHLQLYYTVVLNGGSGGG